MHHLLAYSSSIAQDASLANISALVDEVLAQFTSTVYTPETDLKLLRLYARGDSVTQVRLDSPLLRQIGPPQIFPFETAATPSNLPPINKYDESSLPWIRNDPLAMLISRGGVGAAQCQVLAWVAPQYQQQTAGPARAVRCTSTIVLTVGSWVSGTLTFDQSLPPGRYRIIGMAALGNDLLAARLIFPNQVWRPGALAQQAAGEFDNEWFRRGAFGVYGEFESYAPPTVQALGLVAGSEALTFWLDLVPMSGQTARF